MNLFSWTNERLSAFSKVPALPNRNDSKVGKWGVPQNGVRLPGRWDGGGMNVPWIFLMDFLALLPASSHRAGPPHAVERSPNIQGGDKRRREPGCTVSLGSCGSRCPDYSVG